MNIIVDTNNVFSALLNSESRIGKILIHPKNRFQLYTCDFLKSEILRHRSKLIKLTKLSADELDELLYIVTKNIAFINEALIPDKHFRMAESLLEDIDPGDVPFVALTEWLKGKLWTGDKALRQGLMKKGFRNVITTAELTQLFEKPVRK